MAACLNQELSKAIAQDSPHHYKTGKTFDEGFGRGTEHFEMSREEHKKDRGCIQDWRVGLFVGTSASWMRADIWQVRVGTD